MRPISIVTKATNDRLSTVLAEIGSKVCIAIEIAKTLRKSVVLLRPLGEVRSLALCHRAYHTRSSHDAHLEQMLPNNERDYKVMESLY